MTTIMINGIPFDHEEVTRYHMTDDPQVWQLASELESAQLDYNSKSEESEEFESDLQDTLSELERIRDDLEADLDGHNPTELIEHEGARNRYSDALENIDRLIDRLINRLEE